jgi:uncharacterized protein
VSKLPSKKEQEFFIAQEVARLKKLHEEHMRTQKEEERRRLKELHFMHCAKCGEKMEVTKFEDIEIEICPDCGGIFLDRGELAQIVDEKKSGPFADALAYARRLWTSSE